MKKKIEQTTKQAETKKTTRVFLINKRDKIDEYIRNCVTKYNEFLSHKNDASELNNLNNLLKNKANYFEKSNDIIKQVKQMKHEILDKRDNFVATIKEYAGLFVADQKIFAKNQIIKIEKDYESNVIKVKKEIAIISEEKANLQKLKSEAAKKVKAKIEVIRKELHNETKFDFDIESKQIKKLDSDHKKFVKDKIEARVLVLDAKLTKFHNGLKKLTGGRMNSIAQSIKDAKEKIKEEFLFLADSEKKIIKKIIYFKDFLEDVEYFANDKARNYEIVLAKAKKIKAESSQKIMQDVNELLSFISKSENVFDKVNSLLIGVKHRINNKTLKNKLTNYKESVLNATSSKLLAEKIEEEF